MERFNHILIAFGIIGWLIALYRYLSSVPMGKYFDLLNDYRRAGDRQQRALFEAARICQHTEWQLRSERSEAAAWKHAADALVRSIKSSDQASPALREALLGYQAVRDRWKMQGNN
jgi:hypothetical protein